MKKITISFFLSAILLLAIASAPDVLLAECTDGFCPLADVKGSDLKTLYGTGDGDLVQFLNRLFSLALTVGGILAVFRIAWGGYLYMTTDLWSSKERAKETLRDTVLGLLLLIAVYTILNQINPGLLNLNVLQKLQDNKIKAPTSAPTGDSMGPGGGDSATIPPPEGSACVTSDGIDGQIFNGNCVFLPG